MVFFNSGIKNSFFFLFCICFIIIFASSRLVIFIAHKNYFFTFNNLHAMRTKKSTKFPKFLKLGDFVIDVGGVDCLVIFDSSRSTLYFASLVKALPSVDVCESIAKRDFPDFFCLLDFTIVITDVETASDSGII